MRALLLKDFDMIWRGSRIYLLLLAVFSLIPSPGFVGFALVYAAMFPYQAFAYDERSKWDTMAAMMPFSRRSIVSEKYALGWAAIGAVSALSALSRGVQLLAGREDALEELISIVPMAGFSLFVLAFTVPLVCRFGVEKGRLFFMVLMAVAALGIVSGAAMLDSISAQLDETLAVLLCVAMILVGILAQPLSISIAHRMYRRRFYDGHAA